MMQVYNVYKVSKKRCELSATLDNTTLDGSLVFPLKRWPLIAVKPFYYFHYNFLLSSTTTKRSTFIIQGCCCFFQLKLCIFSCSKKAPERSDSVLPTHQWTRVNTDRHTCPLCRHRLLRSCTVVKRTHSRQSDSERPGNPARRNTRSHCRDSGILPGFGMGLASTCPPSEADCQQMHLWKDDVNIVWYSLFALLACDSVVFKWKRSRHI